MHGHTSSWCQSAACCRSESRVLLTDNLCNSSMTRALCTLLGMETTLQGHTSLTRHCSGLQRQLQRCDMECQEICRIPLRCRSYLQRLPTTFRGPLIEIAPPCQYYVNVSASQGGSAAYLLKLMNSEYPPCITAMGVSFS